MVPITPSDFKIEINKILNQSNPLKIQHYEKKKPLDWSSDFSTIKLCDWSFHQSLVFYVPYPILVEKIFPINLSID